MYRIDPGTVAFGCQVVLTRKRRTIEGTIRTLITKPQSVPADRLSDILPSSHFTVLLPPVLGNLLPGFIFSHEDFCVRKFELNENL